MAKKSNSPHLTVYFDGACVLCSKEIDLYRKRDQKNAIVFVDISAQTFDPKKEGVDVTYVKKVFHVKTSDGQLLTRVDAFVAIWDAIGTFRPLSKAAKSRIFRPLFDLGYSAFSIARPYLPRKKSCENGACFQK